MVSLFDLVEIDDYYIDPKTYVAEWELAHISRAEG